MRVLFMGTPEFAVPTLEAVAERHEIVAAATQPDRPRGRGRQMTPSPVKEWALRNGVPVLQPTTLRDAENQAHLADYEPEIIVVVAYGLILPAEVLEMPPRGCINVHASLLPRHRGAAPVAWAILSGDTVSGVTTMLMDEGLDTGPVLLQREEPLGPRETTGQVTERFASLGAELLVETLDLLAADALEPRPQDDSVATLAPSFKKQDGQIDWGQRATVLERRVRALQPWPGAFTFVGGQRLVIWMANTEPSPDGEGTSRSAGVAGVPDGSVEGPVDESFRAGTVAISGPTGLAIACGDGELLWIEEVQLAGRKRQAVGEFLRGHEMLVGSLLGNEE